MTPAKIIFISDFFVEEIAGGAEQTTAALIEQVPIEFKNSIHHVKSTQLSPDVIKHMGVNNLWILTNTSGLNLETLIFILQNCRYATIDYDYRYCHFRSPELHLLKFGNTCNCANEFWNTFYANSIHNFWMSSKQREIYSRNIPAISRNIRQDKSDVISSAFSSNILDTLSAYRKERENKGHNGKYLILNSQSWIKGVEKCIEYCKNKGLAYDLVGSLSYSDFLKTMAQYAGLVFQPPGGDTCPRLVIEAKLMGLEIHVNDNVQHANEPWFAGSIEEIDFYLRNNIARFWDKINQIENPTISGYVTTYNCESQKYPFIQCIKSLLSFCDEVCVVDGGSTDLTNYMLWNLQREYLIDKSYLFVLTDQYSPVPNEKTRIKWKSIPRDWNDKHCGIFDGLQKAESRNMCVNQFCWQMDVDEVVHENDSHKIKLLIKTVWHRQPNDILSLPVIEYWGGSDKIRMDVTPWKWRLSRNIKNITHGIPKQLRQYDSEGNLYSLPGSDGCDLIDKYSHEILPHTNWYTQEHDILRQACLNKRYPVDEYEKVIMQVVSALPCVYHYSWYDLERKIKTYQKFWSHFWNSLYGGSVQDTAENNMMFDVPWSKVTDQMISDLAKKLKNGTGGWIWHRKWNGTNVPSMHLPLSQPDIMKDFYK